MEQTLPKERATIHDNHLVATILTRARGRGAARAARARAPIHSRWSGPYLEDLSTGLLTLVPLPVFEKWIWPRLAWRISFSAMTDHGTKPMQGASIPSTARPTKEMTFLSCRPRVKTHCHERDRNQCQPKYVTLSSNTRLWIKLSIS